MGEPQVHQFAIGLNFVAAVQLLVGFTEKQALGGLQALTDTRKAAVKSG